jgi:hypothetical protein
MKAKSILFAGVSSLLLAANASAAIILGFGPLSQSSNSPMTGASAEVTLSFTSIDADTVKLSALVKNTTGTPVFGAGATSSKLTGISLNLPSSVASTAAFVPGNYLDTLLTGFSSPPFGTFDIGFADNNNWLGGGPQDALPEGLSDTAVINLNFSFNLTAAAAEAAFLTYYTTNSTGEIAGARFQDVNGGLNRGDSEKLVLTSIPRPPSPIRGVPDGGTTLAFFGVALCGLGSMRRFLAAKS